MNNSVSVFVGIKPGVAGAAEWTTVLQNIKGGRYKAAIDRGRGLREKDSEAYRKYKTTLPAVTFSGTFKGRRNKKNIDIPTGFLIPDIDHVDDIDLVMDMLKMDRHVWFAFISPSGDGIKCGIRARDIKTDDDIKVFYSSVEGYFREIYDIKIDPACKDISRLTFVSHDPSVYVNPKPHHFDIDKWAPKGADPPKKPPKTVAETPLPAMPESRKGDWKSVYGGKVLESRCSDISNSQPGEQHAVRLRAARTVGGFVGQFIDESLALAKLEEAVVASGAKDVRAAMKSVSDALANGKSEPISVSERESSYRNNDRNKDVEYYYDVGEAINGEELSTLSALSTAKQAKHVEQSKAVAKQELSTDPKSLSGLSGLSRIDPGKTPQNLAGHIREWIVNSTGSFTVEQIDREFCLTTRIEKNRRANALSRYKELDIIKTDKIIKGKYRVIDRRLDFINLTDVNEKHFPVRLPFGLEKHVQIPTKAIIVVAGTSNAGKTALALNVLKDNLEQDYDKMYLMSEMGSGEYKSRVMSLGLPLTDWEQVKAAEKSYDFDGAVKGHNKDGLTCIDYLEEVDGEYYKMASAIRDIYDSLGDGVVWINIQKKSGSEYARGGEATKEKARLYMTLDFLCAKKKSIICALKITKLKAFKEQNLLNHEIHFELTKGAVITPLFDWMPAHRINRQKAISKYEAEEDAQGRDGHTFRTVEGPIVRVSEEQANTWQGTFKNIDVNTELNLMSEQSRKKQFLHYKGYFHSLPAILSSKNEKRGEAKK